MFTLLTALAGLTDLEFHLVARLIGTCVCVHMQDSTVSKHPLLMLQIRYICIRYVRTHSTSHSSQLSKILFMQPRRGPPVNLHTVAQTIENAHLPWEGTG